MGGKAFSHLDASMSFPRMDEDTYKQLKEHVTSLLQTVFGVVYVAPEGPGKVDYGDLDVIVSQELPRVRGTTSETCHPPLIQTIKTLLGVSHAIDGRPMNFAIPAMQGITAAGKDCDNEMWRQIDIELVSTEEEVAMTLMMRAYGDLGMMMGMLIRSLGTDGGVSLCLNPKGLLVSSTR